MRNKFFYLFLFIYCFNILIANYKIKNGIAIFNDIPVTRSVDYFYATPADVKTFKIINKMYAKDKYTVYRGANDIVKSDPKTFEPLINGFSKDKNNVYKYENIVKDIDSNTFVIFTNQKNNSLYGYIFFKDKNGIYASSNVYDNLGTYCQLHKSNVDLKSFNILKDGYVEYNGKIYYGCEEINKADKSTFSVLGLGFSKDKNNVYYYTEKLMNFDSDSFKIFSNQREEYYVFYINDKSGVYALIEKSVIPHEYYIEKIEVDLKTFKILENGASEDKKCHYYFDEQIRKLEKICYN